MAFPWDKADLALSMKQKYTVPSKLNASVASLIFPASDRISEKTFSETQSQYIRYSTSSVANANDENVSAGGAKPHDIPDYKGAAEYMKRGFIKLGYENVDHGATESRHSYRWDKGSSFYLNPRASKVEPLKAVGLHLGDEHPSFATDSRDAFKVPAKGERGLNYSERLAINLSINKSKFQLGTEPAPGGGFETTSRQAATSMLAASQKHGEAKEGHHTMHGAIVKKGEEDAAHLAKVRFFFYLCALGWCARTIQL